MKYENREGIEKEKVRDRVRNIEKREEENRLCLQCYNEAY